MVGFRIKRARLQKRAGRASRIFARLRAQQFPRATVIDLARDARIRVSEPDLSRYDLFNADECFLTGTSAEIIPVTGNGKPGPVPLDLVNRYRALTQNSGEPI